MATDLEKLVVQLSADFRQFEKSMARAQGVTNKQFNAIERRARQMNKNLDGIFSRTFRGLTAPLAGIGAALGTREIIRLTDTWTDLNSRVALAAGGMEQGADVMQRLGEVARRTYSSLEQTAEGYLLNATAMRELGYSTSQTLDYTEAVNNALVISGAKGQRAEAVMNALSKAMAGGKLSGDNLNTVIEQGGRLAEALAEGLGVGVNQLRALGQQGKITGRDIVRSLSTQMERLRREAEEMPATISDGVQLLQNALLEYVGNADQATGVSAKISEALVIMADNFDKTADVALQLAGVIAGALVGRSLLKMISTLGLAGSALVNFTRALSAARTMAGLATAFGGLGAAAGPVGLLIGGAVTAAIVASSAASAEAEERTSRLAAEFERLGIRGKKAAAGAEEASAALDEVADEARVQILKDINAELDRMHGRSWNLFGGADDEAKSLDAIVKKAGSTTIMPVGTAIDRDAYQKIMQIAAAVRDGEMAIKDATAAAQELGRTDISEPVRELNNELIKSISYTGELRAAKVASGDTSEFDALTVAAATYRQQLVELSETDAASEDQYRQLIELVDHFTETGEFADDAKKRVEAFEDINLNPVALDIAAQIGVMIDSFAKLAAAAVEADEVLGRFSGGGANFDRGGRVRARQALEARKEESRLWEAEQTRRSKLGKDQLALENEIARVKKQAADDGIRVTDDQIKRIAEANLAGNAARSAEGKKPKKERDDEYERLTKRINESVAAMQAENAVLASMNPLMNDYGYALEKARVQQELLTAAKKAGVEVTPALEKEIEDLAHTYAFATVEAAKLVESHDKIRESAEEALALAKDVTRDLIDGFIEGKSAADIMSNALKKIGNHLINDVLNNLFKIQNMGGGGGGFLSGLLGLFGGGFRANTTAGAFFGAGTGIPQFAGGTNYAPGGLALVGEKGPELVNLPRGSQVIPNHRLNAGGGQTVVVNFNPVIDARGADTAAIQRLETGLAKVRAEIPAQVVESVRKAQKSNVKLS